MYTLTDMIGWVDIYSDMRSDNSAPTPKAIDLNKTLAQRRMKSTSFWNFTCADVYVRPAVVKPVQ